jgi:hypothetical protein
MNELLVAKPVCVMFKKRMCLQTPTLLLEPGAAAYWANVSGLRMHYVLAYACAVITSAAHRRSQRVALLLPLGYATECRACARNGIGSMHLLEHVV